MVGRVRHIDDITNMLLQYPDLTFNKLRRKLECSPNYLRKALNRLIKESRIEENILDDNQTKQYRVISKPFDNPEKMVLAFGNAFTFHFKNMKAINKKLNKNRIFYNIKKEKIKVGINKFATSSTYKHNKKGLKLLDELIEEINQSIDLITGLVYVRTVDNIKKPLALQLQELAISQIHEIIYELMNTPKHVKGKTQIEFQLRHKINGYNTIFWLRSLA